MDPLDDMILSSPRRPRRAAVPPGTPSRRGALFGRPSSSGQDQDPGTNIDDILEELDARNEEDHKMMMSSGARDIDDLTKSWVAERGAPEVLPFQMGLVERVMERVRMQIEIIERESGNLTMDPKANFRLVVMQTELERVKFLVRAYLRVRIAKIDKYALHVLRTPSLRDRLHPSELSYLKSHQALLTNHYLASFLRNFPEQLRRLDDTAGGISMIEEPDLDGAVFCRVVKNMGGLSDDGDGDEYEGGGEERRRDKGKKVRIKGTGTEFVLRKGDVYVVRYSAVRDYVLAGEVELI